MAITITKAPALFFNCTNPAIFEFTTDSVVGNFDDYVCDIFIYSAYATKTAVIRNIFPNTATKIFSVDVSEFLKALQLGGFDYSFDSTKNLSIEKFTLNLNIRDGSQPDDEAFNFDAYYFDNFVFTDGLNNVDETEESFYSILGGRLDIDNFNNKLVENKLTFLEADNIEYCPDFDNYISVFNNEMNSQTISILGNSYPITYQKGVSTFKIPIDIKSKTEITSSNQNALKKLFAIPSRFDNCAKVVQFRYYNRLGGYSYFYAEMSDESATRSKVEFYNRSYINENENKSNKVQSNSDYAVTLKFQGSKIIDLKENFDMLLRSEKVEMNLKKINGNDLFIECEVTGSVADRYTAFDFLLTAKL